MIKDFKHTSKALLSLKKDINHSFRKIIKKEMGARVKPAVHFKLPFAGVKKIAWLAIPVAAVVLGVLLIPFLLAGMSSRSTYDRCSFIGEVKIKEEFQGSTNQEGQGGPEIQATTTNSGDLNFFFYKVKQGESLSTIAQKLGVSMDTLISLNSMENVHNISSGQRLIYPNVQGIIYNVKKNDTLQKIASTYKIDTSDILDANDLEESLIHEGMVLFLPGARLTENEKAKVLGDQFFKPIHGRFTSGFGIRKDPFTGDPGYHAGIDIGAPWGSVIRCSRDGVVTYAGWNGGYGYCVIVKHQFGGYETVYGHMSSISVRVGSYVKANQKLGYVGSSGRSTGSHLHFEVRKYGRPINPTRIAGLKRNGGWY